LHSPLGHAQASPQLHPQPDFSCCVQHELSGHFSHEAQSPSQSHLHVVQSLHDFFDEQHELSGHFSHEPQSPSQSHLHVVQSLHDFFDEQQLDSFLQHELSGHFSHEAQSPSQSHLHVVQSLHDFFDEQHELSGHFSHEAQFPSQSHLHVVQSLHDFFDEQQLDSLAQAQLPFGHLHSPPCWHKHLASEADIFLFFFFFFFFFQKIFFLSHLLNFRRVFKESMAVSTDSTLFFFAVFETWRCAFALLYLPALCLFAIFKKKNFFELKIDRSTKKKKKKIGKR
jgi:hypothetical protein